MRRCGLPALMLTAIVAASCAGSDAADPAGTVELVAPDGTEVDLAEGAFERTDGGESSTDGSPPATESAASEPTTSGAAPGDDADSATDDASEDSAATTTDGGSSNAGSTSGGSGSTATSDGTSGSSTDGAPASGDTTTGGSDGTTTTDGGSTGSGTTDGPVAPNARPGEGIIVVGGEEYLFPASTCLFEAGSVLIEGNGISTAFDRFEASIFYAIEDFDDDGSDDTTLDVVIDFEVPASGDSEDLPELYADKVESQNFSRGADITVTVEGEHIFGAGLMTDYNGVVFPIDEPGPMAFDARCS